jgi:hypothetical protein
VLSCAAQCSVRRSVRRLTRRRRRGRRRRRRKRRRRRRRARSFMALTTGRLCSSRRDGGHETLTRTTRRL